MLTLKTCLDFHPPFFQLHRKLPGGRLSGAGVVAIILSSPAFRQSGGISCPTTFFMSTTFFRLLLFLLIFTGANATAQPDGLFGGGGPAAAAREVKATLVAGSTAIVPGEPLEVALKLEHPEHWHTY